MILNLLMNTKTTRMKKKILPAFLILFLSAMVILNFSCKTSSEETKEETKGITEIDETVVDQETEDEIAKLEAEAPSKEMNTLSRSSSSVGSAYEFDDDCSSRCESILDKQSGVTASGSLQEQHRECIQQCMEEKAKQLAKEEAEKEQQEKEQVKEFILKQAKENFQRCINKAKSEEEKEMCREDYRKDKEFYYNYGK